MKGFAAAAALTMTTALPPAAMRPTDPALARMYFFRDYDASGTVAPGSTGFVRVYSVDFYAAQSTAIPFGYSGPATFADVVVKPRLAAARMAKLHPQE